MSYQEEIQSEIVQKKLKMIEIWSVSNHQNITSTTVPDVVGTFYWCMPFLVNLEWTIVHLLLLVKEVANWVSPVRNDEFGPYWLDWLTDFPSILNSKAGESFIVETGELNLIIEITGNLILRQGSRYFRPQLLVLTNEIIDMAKIEAKLIFQSTSFW